MFDLWVPRKETVSGVWSQRSEDSDLVFHAVHVLCLCALFVGIILNFITLRNFIKRNRGLDMQLDGCHDSRAPALFVSSTLVAVISAMFVAGIIDYSSSWTLGLTAGFSSWPAFDVRMFVF